MTLMLKHETIIVSKTFFICVQSTYGYYSGENLEDKIEQIYLNDSSLSHFSYKPDRRSSSGCRTRREYHSPCAERQ